MSSETTCDVLVVGAGPAGSAAARALAREGVRVLLCERSKLPRHRLCGEFLSPEATFDLEALGLDVRSQGAVALATARVAAGTSAVETAFERPAYGLSRFVLDHWLAVSAAAAGARLCTETRLTHLEGDAGHGFVATLEGRDGGSVRARFVIGATGKQLAEFQRPHIERAVPGWVALKTHWRHDGPTPLRVELHPFQGGYLGLAPVGSGRVNVCAVAHPDALPAARGAGAAGVLAKIVERIPDLRAEWAGALVDPQVTCSESGARFGVTHPVWRDVLLVGDAAALPHPVGGDGMAMAIRAGRLAAAFALAALTRRIDPQAMATAYATAWQREFAARLRWCARLHGALERPWLVRPLLEVLGVWPAGMRYVVERTRGAAALEASIQEVHA